MTSVAPPGPPQDRPETERSERYLTLVEHLQELRRRLIICSVAVVVGLAISAYFTGDLLRFLKHPAEERSQDFRLVFLEPFESFVTYFKIALMSSIVLAMPVIMYQILAFVAPGLKANEKRWLYGTVAGSVGLFLAGVAFAYYVALPPALGFLLNFQNDIAEPQIRLGSYFDFVLRLLFWTGVAFQTPLIVMFLARLRIVTARRLIGWWRFAIVGAFVVAAVVTPTPDPVTCTIVALPLIGLYFLGVALAVAVQPRGPSRAQ
ncbi:MAG: twin-arginine translocase subunit TatC [Chloroflexi bacterium]|jgi:sec-independent protein translocase protein TatC|nr:MAG: twin-arginine translocase subunit TatC [Chloroflexota bacterium]